MILIREITINDLTDNFFKLLSQLSGELKDYDKSDLWEKYMQMKPGIVTLVAIEDDGVRGTATILIENKFLHCGSKVGHIEDVVVDQNIRTKGLGKDLIEKCIQIAADNKCYKVILDCEENVVPFYAKCGFRPENYSMRRDRDGNKKKKRKKAN